MVKRSAQIVLARRLGRAVGITLGVLRTAVRVAPGMLGAAAVALGCGEVVQRVFGRGLGWPAGLVVAGVFALWFAAEVNRAPRRPSEPPEYQ